MGNLSRKNFFIATALLILSTVCHGAAGNEIDLNEVETGSFAEPVDLSGAKAERIRVIAFNIRFGLKVDSVIEYLKTQVDFPGALVILLSEVDRHFSRTNDENLAAKMAGELKMNYAYGVEFVELNDETPETQGVTGNAILSRLPISNTKVVRHSEQYEWGVRGGSRSALVADIGLPDGKSIRVVSAHLENRADNEGRAAQMDEIIEAVKDSEIPVTIGGDLNETAGGPMFKRLAEAGFENAFRKDSTTTCDCTHVANGKAMCFIKVDWIFYRGLGLKGRRVDDVVDSKGKLFSDHKPVRADFEFENY
ncbi:MAG: endonuclease/exonuclease/phosphatase family protein [bacterium]